MTPRCQIISNRADITASILGQLISIEVQDEIGVKSDRLTIKLADHEGRLALPDEGTQIQPFLGFQETGLWPLGLFTVEEVSLDGWEPQTMTLSCVAADMTKEIKAPRSQSYNAMSIGDIVATIAARNGLSPCVAPEIKSKVIAHIDQTEESDMNFLLRLAEQQDAVFKPQAGKLSLAMRGKGQACDGTVLPVPVITKAQMMKPSFRFKQRPQTKDVKAAWQDRGAAKRDVGQGSGGGKVGTSQLRGTFATKSEAQDAAKAQANKSKRDSMSGSFELEGRGDVFAGCHVQLIGIRAAIDGLWSVKSVRHRFNASGYIMSVSVEPPIN